MNKNLTEAERIHEYYSIQGLIPVFPRGIHECLLARGKKNSVIISDNKIIRGIARLIRLRRSSLQRAKESAFQFFAMDEAFQLLAQKGVPVYFYNRVGKKKNGYKYRDSEKSRMRRGLSFPKMYEDIDKYENELQEIFGNLYAKGYVKEIGKIPQVIKIAGTYVHEDYKNEYINVENGRRITVGQPKAYNRTLHIYGRCGVFGYAVEDAHTIPSFLQMELISRGFTDIKVINHGLWGGEDIYIDHNFLQESMGFKKGDIVIFYRKHFPMKLLEKFMSHGVKYKDITEVWHTRRATDKRITFYNQPGHMNSYGYALAAKIICDDLIATNFMENLEPKVSSLKVDTLKEYIKTHMDVDFASEIESYIKKIQKEHPISDNNVTNGAIVMNCNPFTKGHRYLIEYASKQVDHLFIFVVEENKSFFLFEDRLKMVKNGTDDLQNVIVVPSGKFIISAYTFPEYFMKDYVKEKNFDISLDIKTFCQYIAPKLNIKLRFAGEEPDDPVTCNYNENMAKILPQYGISFVEIPRLKISKTNEMITATKVRELISRKMEDELVNYLPSSTMKIVKDKYMEA